MLCNICNDDVFEGDNLNCIKCKAILHYGCAALRESAFRKMSNFSRQNWLCNKCKVNKQTAKTPTNYNASNIVQFDTQKSQNETIKNLVESVNFMSDKFDNFSKQLQDLITTINCIKDENIILREENGKLKNEIVSLDKRMNVLEQKALENFVEIVGVQDFHNEDCVKTVVSIAASVGINNLSVSKAFRIPSKDISRPRKIVAELLSFQNKRTLMENVKKSKLSGNSVNSNWKDDKIYINDSLTNFNKDLFFKTRAFARDKGYKYVWFKKSKIFIKKSEHTKAFIINDEHSLLKLSN